MKRLLPDTNIYGLLTVDQDLHQLHREFESRKTELKIYGFSIIRKELKKVPKKLINGVNVQASLLKTYSYFVTKEYEIEDQLRSIADEYYRVYLSQGGSLIKEDIYNDLLIVACASVKDIDLVVSEDNATLGSEMFKKAYSTVNLKKGIRQPTFIKYKQFKELLLGTAFSDPFIDKSNKFGIFLGLFNLLEGILFLFHRLSQEKLIYKYIVS